MSMQFESFQQAWDMAGHGPYVWTAVLVSVFVLCWLMQRPLVQHRKSLNSIAVQMRREKMRQATNPEEYS